jgi:hypothetical protein
MHAIEFQATIQNEMCEGDRVTCFRTSLRASSRTLAGLRIAHKRKFEKTLNGYLTKKSEDTPMIDVSQSMVWQHNDTLKIVRKENDVLGEQWRGDMPCNSICRGSVDQLQSLCRRALDGYEERRGESQWP